MKIAMIGQKGIPAIFGGIERHVEELSEQMVQRGHEVTVYTRHYYTNPKRRNFHGVNLVSLPSLQTKHLDTISHVFLATLHALCHDFDIIHYHGVGPSLLSFLPRIFRPGVRVVTTFHCIDRRHKKWGWFARLMLRLGEWAAVSFPHRAIANSRTIQDYCRQVYRKSMIYIPYGISGQYLKRLAAREIKKKYGLKAGQYILAVSRLIPHKGIHYLIQAYKRLPTKKKLVVVGGGFYTDAYVRQLKELAAGDPRIIFTGSQTGRLLAELFSNPYLFVHPSEAEGLPIALMEAAGYGNCVLVSDIPENMEVLQAGNEVIGYAFKNKNIKDLQHKLAGLLRRPTETKKIGRLARKTILKQFNWQSTCRQTEKLYSLA